MSVRLKRWQAVVRYCLEDGTEEEIIAGTYFTRWGAKESLTWKLGSTPIAMLWARGYVQWIKGEVRELPSP